MADLEVVQGDDETRVHNEDIPGSDGVPASNVTRLFPDEGQNLRMVEALLFAASEPLSVASLADRLPNGVDVGALIEDLKARYDNRGVNLVQIAGKWAFRTAPDLAFLLRREAVETRRLSRAAIETLAIVAYHQPVTRAEIEQVRGVTVSKGTLDVLLEIGWIRPRGRRRTPGRPLTFGTSENFLEHFNLESLGDLPGMDDLKAAGFLDFAMPADFDIPVPRDRGDDELAEDEDPLEDEDTLDLAEGLEDDETGDFDIDR